MYIPLEVRPGGLGRTERRAYLKRIGAVGAFLSDFDHLAHLQQRHLLSIPLETFDAAAGLRSTTREGALFGTLVSSSRGGAPHELNLLFAWLLRDLGFTVDPVTAVEPGSDPDAAPVGLLLMVPIDGVPHLLDVGHHLPALGPIPLVDGAESAGRLARISVASVAPGRWRLETSGPRTGIPIVDVVAEPVTPARLERIVASFDEQAIAEARVSGARVRIATEEGVAELVGATLTVLKGESVRRTELDPDRRERMLEHLFGLDPAALPRR